MFDVMERIFSMPPDEREVFARELFVQSLNGGETLRDICVTYLMVAYQSLPAFAHGWAMVGDELVLDAGSIELRARRARGPRPIDAPPWQWAASFVTQDEHMPFACGAAVDEEDAKERAIMAARLRVVAAFPFLL